MEGQERLFQGGDYWRDDYYSRKYGNCAIKNLTDPFGRKSDRKIKKENKNKMVNYNCENKR